MTAGESVEQALAKFPSISLEEMKSVGLMNRTDTKFVTTRARLVSLLQLASGEYYVQEAQDTRINNYSTVYFDTPRCDMFRKHQNGKTNRQKLRIRLYKEWGATFLEIKTKDNHLRTDKKRIRIHPSGLAIEDKTSLEKAAGDERKQCGEFVSKYLRYDADSLSEQIENRFRRITLVNRNKTERLTIDLDISFHNLKTDCRLTLDNIVIIELKRDGRKFSPVIAMLKSLRIKPMGFSKYCIGMAMTDPELPRNRIKQRLRNISKMQNNN